MSATEPIRDERKAQELLTHFLDKGEPRNHVLAVLGVYTALRISDILRIVWDDIYDFETGKPREHLTVTEKKTGKTKKMALHEDVKAAINKYKHSAARGKPLIINERTGRAISRIQAYRIIRAAAEEINIPERVSCHSLRKTFGYHAWKNGASQAVITEIYNHSSYATTRRYLGITQDDINDVYLSFKLTA